MKKFLKFSHIFFLLPFILFLTGCNHYVKIDVSDENNTTYYGALNRRDLIWADVIVYKKNSNQYCDGIAFLEAQKNASTSQVRLACSDGKVINLNWNLENEKFSGGSAIGFDQYNVKYKLSPIKRKEFMKNSSVKTVVIPNSKTDFILKY